MSYHIILIPTIAFQDSRQTNVTSVFWHDEVQQRFFEPYFDFNRDYIPRGTSQAVASTPLPDNNSSLSGFKPSESIITPRASVKSRLGMINKPSTGSRCKRFRRSHTVHSPVKKRKRSQKQNPRKQNPRKQNPRKQNPRKQNPQKQNPRKQNPRKQNPQKQNLQKQNPQKQNPQKQKPSQKQNKNLPISRPCNEQKPSHIKPLPGVYFFSWTLFAEVFEEKNIDSDSHFIEIFVRLIGESSNYGNEDFAGPSEFILRINEKFGSKNSPLNKEDKVESYESFQSRLTEFSDKLMGSEVFSASEEVSKQQQQHSLFVLALMGNAPTYDTLDKVSIK